MLGGMDADAIVIGGGMVGSAIGCGLLRHGWRVVMLDEGDRAFRAARGNFGLVWVQGKGLGAPHYTRWSLGSANAWAEFAAALHAETGVDLRYRRAGGLVACLGEEELEARARVVARHRRELGAEGFEIRMLGRAELCALVPNIGADVLGASFTPYDGTANPLRLLRALHAAFVGRGGSYLPDGRAHQVGRDGDAFTVRTSHAVHRAPKLVIAAGLGTPALAAQLGVAVPLVPQRGQILVTERLAPVLGLPMQTIRQTEEGSVIIGNSAEEAGFDARTRAPVMAAMARRAVLCYPALARARIVRAWGALRIMTPDGLPLYTRAPAHAGAHIAVCHSGVTLAAAHHGPFADWIAGGRRPAETVALAIDRFDVPAAAE